MNSYQPLARRYRPTQFEGVNGAIDQPHVTRTLKNAVASGLVAQAYLLSGPRGTGKTTMARVLAAALNCPHRSPDGEPCGTCESCAPIVQGLETMDVRERDGASNRGVEDARKLREQLMYAPSSENRWKVEIIDEAHMLTREAWNALLKAIEEPPPRTVFVFATTEPEKIEQTAKPVLSRCQHFAFRRISLNGIVERLRQIARLEGIKVTDEALVLIARHADGGMRDALSTLDQLRAFEGDANEISVETVRQIFGIQPEKVFLNTIDILIEGARDRTFRLIKFLNDQGADFVRFFFGLNDALLALSMVKERAEPEGWSKNGVAGLRKRAEKISAEQLVQCLVLAQETEEAIRRASRPQIALTIFLQRAISEISTKE